MHPLAGITAAIEYTLRLAMHESPQWSYSTHIQRLYSIHICGDYVGVLFKCTEPFENRKNKNELVVWSWRTGVQHLSVSISSTSLGSLAAQAHEACSFSRYYRQMCNPSCFSTTILSWHPHRHHLQSLSIVPSRELLMTRRIFCVSYWEPVFRARTTQMMIFS